MCEVFMSIYDDLVVYIPVDGDPSNKSNFQLQTVVTNAVLAADRNGKLESAYYFDGSSKIEIQYDPVLNFGTKDITMMVWVKFNTFDHAQRIIDGGSSWCSTHPGYMFRTSGNRILQEKTCNGGSGCEISNESNAALAINQWYHIITVLQNGQSPKIYINGVLDKEGSDPSPACDASFGSNHIYLGFNQYLYQDNGNGEFLNGYLDEIAIWHRALNASEVQQLYNSPITTISLLPTSVPTSVLTPESPTKFCTKDGIVGAYDYVDWNGDGKVDIVCSHYDYTKEVYLSTGTNEMQCIGFIYSLNEI